MNYITEKEKEVKTKYNFEDFENLDKWKSLKKYYQKDSQDGFSDDILLPFPKKRKEVIKLYDNADKEKSRDDVNMEHHYLEIPFRDESKEDKGFEKEGLAGLDIPLNLLYYRRGKHILNEACNKLWSTLELYGHLAKNEYFFESFNDRFTCCSTISTLYYAAYATVMSALHFFGLGLNESNNKSNYVRFNFIRTKNGLRTIKRTRYHHSIGQGGKSHKGVIYTLINMANNGFEIPEIHPKKIDELRKKKENMTMMF